MKTEKVEVEPRVTQSPNGPDLTKPDVLGACAIALVLIGLASGAMAAPKAPEGYASPVAMRGEFFQAVVLTEDPMPWGADGPDTMDPIGVKGGFYGGIVGLDATTPTNPPPPTCNDAACVVTCEQSLRSPYCTVTSATCNTRDSCSCIYFCLRNAGVQWTPTMEMTPTVSPTGN